jgi:hypothetical protein
MKSDLTGPAKEKEIVCDCRLTDCEEAYNASDRAAEKYSLLLQAELSGEIEYILLSWGERNRSRHSQGRLKSMSGDRTIPENRK